MTYFEQQTMYFYLLIFYTILSKQERQQRKSTLSSLEEFLESTSLTMVFEKRIIGFSLLQSS